MSVLSRSKQMRSLMPTWRLSTAAISAVPAPMMGAWWDATGTPAPIMLTKDTAHVDLVVDAWVVLQRMARPAHKVMLAREAVDARAGC